MRVNITIKPVTIPPRFRIGMFPMVLLILAAAAFVVAMIRYVSGIGVISNLSNAYPWAFWISFDLLTGVALASGAFTLAAVVEIFQVKSLQPLMRPALLTGFLGYIMYIFALLVDLGHPERIWHYFIYQNPHSILFECGILVMVISFTYVMIFAPDFFDRIHKPGIGRVFRYAYLPFIILLVVASVLHQASLGSIYLIMPTKLHPLWYTPILPLLFIVSSLAFGLAMTIFESSMSSRYFKRGLETHLLAKLALAIVYILGLYLVIKFVQLAIAGNLGLLLTSGWLSFSFWAEILIGAILPMILFVIKGVRQSPRWLLVGAVLTLLGLMLNRFNVSWFAIRHADPLSYVPTFMNKVSYIPSIPEVAISIGIFSAGILAFGLAVKFLPIFDDEHHEADAAAD